MAVLAAVLACLLVGSPLVQGGALVPSGCPFANVQQVFGGSVTTKNEWFTPNPATPSYFLGIKLSEGDFSAPSSCSASQYNAIAGLIRAQGLIISPPDFLRLGFHTGGSSSAQDRSVGGVNGGWLRYPIDRNFAANAGLEDALSALEKIKLQYPCITFADLCTFGGALAPEMGGKGPAIAWHPGRRDSLVQGPTTPPHSARLPDGMFNAAGVLSMGVNLGLTLREIVLMVGGGHTFGGAHLDTSGWNGRFTSFNEDWPTPDNKYFIDSTQVDWIVDTVNPTNPPGKLQFIPAPGQEAKIGYFTADSEHRPVFRFPADIGLIESKTFRPFLDQYAADNALFLKHFTRTYQRFLQMGVNHGYKLDSSYVWKGFKGTAIDYGTDIAPLV